MRPFLTSGTVVVLLSQGLTAEELKVGMFWPEDNCIGRRTRNPVNYRRPWAASMPDSQGFLKPLYGKFPRNLSSLQVVTSEIVILVSELSS